MKRKPKKVILKRTVMPDGTGILALGDTPEEATAVTLQTMKGFGYIKKNETRQDNSRSD